MPCSPSKRSTRLTRGMNRTMSGHHPPVKHRKPPVRLCPAVPLSGRFTRTNLRFGRARHEAPAAAEGHAAEGHLTSCATDGKAF